MKWLTNLYDPTRKDAMSTILVPFGMTIQEAWTHQQEWLKDKVIGDPKATKWYSVDELKAMHMVGVYAEEA